MARPIDSAQSDICRRLVDLDGDCGGGGLITGCCGDDDDDDVEMCSETESIHDGRTDGWTLVLKLAVTGSAVMCAGTASDDTTYTRVYLYT